MDQKTSLLVSKQVPDFIRSEYPKFISFLEAYYEFLENKQSGQNNDLLQRSKDLRTITDVDYSLEEFENYFFNSFLNLFPSDISVSKDILIKNVLPIYLSKGSEKSFKLLYRMLFGDSVVIQYPKNSILRASDGNWLIENTLRTLSSVKTEYIGDGLTEIFKLCQQVVSSEIVVKINDTIQTSGFNVFKELKRIEFDTAPLLNDVIEIEYLSFDVTLLVNRQVRGVTSEASALIERTSERLINRNRVYNLFINSKTLKGQFQIGEEIETDVILDDGTLQVLNLQTLSELKTITIEDGGASYNVGDPVTIIGTATEEGIAVVSEVATGLVEEIVLENGGAGFQLNEEVYVPGIDESIFDGFVETINDSGLITPNTVTFYTDTIGDFTSISIGGGDYGFPAAGVEDINTVIGTALTSNTINVGSIATVNISNSSIFATAGIDFEVDGPIVSGTVLLRDLGILGKIDINSGGQNYQVGDQLIFTNLPGVFTGYGAAAEVAEIDEENSNAISRIVITDGGTGYVPGDFPTITVNSVSGTGADLSVYCIMGDGEFLQAFVGDEKPGQILKIKILYPGIGYIVTPAIDLTESGNGQAVANVELRDSYITLPGRWTETRGLLSTEDVRLQGADYYIDFSYVLSSRTEFSKYRDIFKNLVHPAGHILHTEYEIHRFIETDRESVQNSEVEITLSGTVNVNSSIYVIGTGTKFTNGIIETGNTIAINSETRIVDTIISDTELTVTSAFTITTNNETLLITS